MILSGDGERKTQKWVTMQDGGEFAFRLPTLVYWLSCSMRNNCNEQARNDKIRAQIGGVKRRFPGLTCRISSSSSMLKATGSSLPRRWRDLWKMVSKQSIHLIGSHREHDRRPCRLAVWHDCRSTTNDGSLPLFQTACSLSIPVSSILTWHIPSSLTHAR